MRNGTKIWFLFFIFATILGFGLIPFLKQPMSSVFQVIMMVLGALLSDIYDKLEKKEKKV